MGRATGQAPRSWARGRVPGTLPPWALVVDVIGFDPGVPCLMLVLT